jgi:hypothetical protein
LQELFDGKKATGTFWMEEWNDGRMDEKIETRCGLQDPR